MIKRKKFLGSDRIGFRIILLSLLYLIYTTTVTIPKSNGVDASTEAGIIFSYLALLFFTVPVYLFRKLVLKSWSALRSVMWGAIFEITVTLASDLAIAYSWRWGVPFEITAALAPVILIHAVLFLWLNEKFTKEAQEQRK